ncbi:MAG: hypothetical protein R6U55_06215 [Desulfovermiculus sp.]
MVEGFPALEIGQVLKAEVFVNPAQGGTSCGQILVQQQSGTVYAAIVVELNGLL